MSGEKTEKEMGGVLLNGVGSQGSPGVGVSGSRPLVNGDLRDGDSEGKSAVLTESAGEGGSSSAGKQEDDVVKVNSAKSVYNITQYGSTVGVQHYSHT